MLILLFSNLILNSGGSHPGNGNIWVGVRFEYRVVFKKCQTLRKIILSKFLANSRFTHSYRPSYSNFYRFQDQLLFTVLSIKDSTYRNKIIQGDTMQSKYTSAIFQLDTDKPEEVKKQSELVLKELPQVDTF